MKGQWNKLAWISIAIVLLTVGCSPGATQSIPTPAQAIAPPAQPPAPTATPAPSFPKGVFTKLGWAWEFKPDGSYFNKSQWDEDYGTYSVTGNQVAFQGDYVPCRKFVGTYTWTFDGQVLILHRSR